ncbi:unnamed protein product [Heterobilharzia americana]|nr:unnamed protein product [Heterobilharzia americana]
MTREKSDSLAESNLPKAECLSDYFGEVYSVDHDNSAQRWCQHCATNRYSVHNKRKSLTVAEPQTWKFPGSQSVTSQASIFVSRHHY